MVYGRYPRHRRRFRGIRRNAGADAPGRPRRMTPQHRMLLVIGMVALLLRLAPMARPDLKFQVGWDAADYIPLAQGIQHGCGFARYTNGRCGNPDMSRPPGYPFFVAMMPGLRSVLVIQAVLGSMLCVWLGWFVMKRWGFAAG